MLKLTQLYQRLDAIRVSRRLTWRQVAQESGVDPSLFSKLKKGNYPHVNNLIRLLLWGDIELNELVKVETSPASKVCQLSKVIGIINNDRSLTTTARDFIIATLTASYQTKL